MLEAQSAGQRQPGLSRGDPAGQAERPPTLTAGCLDRPSFGATVDHRAGACGSAQQRRDQLHDARAASEAGPDLQAVSTPELTAPRERSVGRERQCFIGPLRAAAGEAVEARRNPKASGPSPTKQARQKLPHGDRKRIRFLRYGLVRTHSF